LKLFYRWILYDNSLKNKYKLKGWPIFLKFFWNFRGADPLLNLLLIMKKNKKIFIIAVLFAMVLPLANPAQAATARELQSQIAALLAQIQTLRQQLTQLQGGTTTWCHTFNKNLRYGDEGMEVGALIKALQLQGV